MQYFQVALNQSVTPMQQKRIDFVDLIEAVTYVVCHENAVSSESFYNIFSEVGYIETRSKNKHSIHQQDIVSLCVT